MTHELATVQLEKPDDLIFSPQLVSQAASYMLNAVLLNERVNDHEINDERRISIRDVRLLIGAEKSHNAAFLEKVLDELVSIKIKWGELLGPDDGERKSDDGQPDRLNVIVPFLQKAAYRSRSDGTVDPERGYIIYKLSDPIHEIIRARRSLTNVHVLMQRQFERPYSFRLYEVFQSLFQKQSGANAISQIYTIQFLRTLLGVDGYPVFGDFNKYILKPNIEEVNLRSEFSIEVKPLRKGKAVYALEFTAARKREFQLQLDLATGDKLPKLLERALQAKRVGMEREQVLKRLSDYKISRTTAADVIDQLGLEAVEAIVAKVDADIASGYKPRSRTAYMRSCLAGDSAPGEHAASAGVEALPPTPVVDTLMEEFGLSQRDAAALCREVPPEQIDSALAYVRQQKANTGKVYGKGYVIRAIRDDYGADLRAQAAAEAARAVERQAEETLRQRQIDEVRATFETLPAEQRAGLVKDFLERPPPGWGRVTEDEYRRTGLNGRYVSDLFFRLYLPGRLAGLR